MVEQRKPLEYTYLTSNRISPLSFPRLSLRCVNRHSLANNDRDSLLARLESSLLTISWSVRGTSVKKNEMEVLIDCYFDKLFEEMDRSCLASRYKRREMVGYFSDVINSCSQGNGTAL